MQCGSCRRDAETKYVEFYQNIGLVVKRYHWSLKGRLCKSCIHVFFWKMTGTTFFLGWWGVISFAATLFIIPNNIIRYLFCLRMRPVGHQARLSKEDIARIKPHLWELFMRISKGDDRTKVIAEIAARTATTPAQVEQVMRLIGILAKKKSEVQQKATESRWR